MQKKQSNKGFTLLEITATLMIIMIISGIASISISHFIDTYALHRQHSEVSQQARIIINRLLNEFLHITMVHHGASNRISFRSRFNNQADTSITFTNNRLEINDIALSDEVTDFQLRYLKSAKVFNNVSQQMWDTKWEKGKSTAIQFDLTFTINTKILSKEYPNTVTFSNITVVPRALSEK